MSHRAPTARLFVAIEPPEDVRTRLAGWARTALRGAGVRTGSGSPARVLDAELLHVTLCFLGDQRLDDAPAIAAQLAAVAETVGELSIGAPLWLPPRHPRVLAVELHDDSDRLDGLHRRLLPALREVCELPEDGRGGGGRRHRFHPHITLARLRSGAAPRERTLAPTPSLSFQPHELVLYRSWLSPEGASYEPLATCTLV